MPEIAVQAAQRLSRLGGEAAQVRAWLLPVWERMVDPAQSALPDQQALKVVQALEASLEGLDALWLARIEAAQQANPRDARLQYLSAVACMQRELWARPSTCSHRRRSSCATRRCAPAPGATWRNSPGSAATARPPRTLGSRPPCSARQTDPAGAPRPRPRHRYTLPSHFGASALRTWPVALPPAWVCVQINMNKK
ncbi:HemY domain-containing protein [Alicycliphilus sp. B1]|nr:HemY domain-containing protein [Alicycliphilus sp. B1]